MKKLLKKTISGMARAEYIEVEPNIRLHISDAGEGRPIVLLPGWPLSDEMYEYQYNDLIKNNFRVIGITLRGFGKSDKPYSAYTYDVHASDIKKVLDTLKIKDAILGGFSMGGAIAIRYVAQVDHGVHISQLALFGAAAPIWTQRKDFPYNLPQSAVDNLIKLNNQDRPKLLSNFAKIFSATKTSLSKGIGDWLYGINLSASSYAMAQCLLALRDTDLRSDLAKIKIPTVIMHGKKDKICSFDLAKQMKAGISDSTIVAFENSGHSLFLEETHKFNTELIKFANKRSTLPKMRSVYAWMMYLIVGVMIMMGGCVYAVTSKDIATNQYHESIQYLYDHGVVQGYPDGTFGPDREINRAEIMKIIVKSSLGDDIGSLSKCFPDVREDRFARYVCYAKDHGIVKGYDDGTFRPYQSVAIAEALKMGIESFAINVGQVNGTDSWYQPYFEFVHNNNIFSKYALLPNKNMTRGEMTYLVHQLMLNKEGSREFTNQREATSAGCGKEPPNMMPTSSVVSGLTRHYITVIGNRYDKNTSMKIIFAFHGRTNPNTEVQEYYDLDEELHGDAIIIYPAGLPEDGPSRSWSSPGDKSYQLRDFALFDQLLKEFENNYCINKDQVFVVGHSLGARFTNSLSCARGNVIRAIGSVGGGTTINKCNGPVASMIMQNPADNLSPYSAGVTARDQMLKQNGCGTATAPYGSVGNCVKYTDCQKDAPVIRCPYTDSYESHGTFYPHMRPDYAGKTIMDFFESL